MVDGARVDVSRPAASRPGNAYGALGRVPAPRGSMGTEDDAHP